MSPSKPKNLLLACQAAIVGAVVLAPSSLAFTTSPIRLVEKVTNQIQQGPFITGPEASATALHAADGKKKKRRRRKDAPAVERSTSSLVDQPKPSPPPSMDTIQDAENRDEVTEEDIFTLKDVANFEFDSGVGVKDEPVQNAADAINLPDIKEQLKKKEEEERARIEEEKLKDKRRIKRSDKEAFARLLEQQPYADADDTFFEVEKYGTVSALLGEGAKPFLGIPTGPLQVGHFIGALTIILMAFVEYPGFPLTNLPTPLRDFLQGGLAVTYTINFVLAIFAAFMAGEREQPLLLWVPKTFFVGGLAYDQLSQLPTKEQVKKAEAMLEQQKK